MTIKYTSHGPVHVRDPKPARRRNDGWLLVSAIFCFVCGAVLFIAGILQYAGRLP